MTSLIRRFTNQWLNPTKATTNPKRGHLLWTRLRVTTPSMSSFQFSSVNDLKVEHNPKKHQFFVRLGSEKAVIDYRDVEPNVINLFHTEVPQSLQGKGIAKLLAKEAFDYVVRNDLKMIVSCSYLLKYLNDVKDKSYYDRLFTIDD